MRSTNSKQPLNIVCAMPSVTVLIMLNVYSLFNSEKLWICYNWNHYDDNRMKIAPRLFHWMARISTYRYCTHHTIYNQILMIATHTRGMLKRLHNFFISDFHPWMPVKCTITFYSTLLYSTVNFIHFHTQKKYAPN